MGRRNRQHGKAPPAPATPRPNGAEPAPRREILVGLDFGTTFSGAAWSSTARPELQTAIVQWPDVEGSIEGETSDKVPTQICYEGGQTLWGFGIPEDKQRHQWFKLALDPSQKNNDTSLLAMKYPDPKALPPGYDIQTNAVKLTTDYLAEVHKHVTEILKIKLGETVVNTTPIRYTITVPAIWTDAAKARTQRCASQASMGWDVQIVSEPEAAVIYALDSMDPDTLKAGDNFVLCDAGGGTVDLITYTIVSLKPIVKVRETVPGGGGACGSTFLNRIFAKHLQENLGELDGFDDDTLEDAMKDFENTAKRKFTGKEENVVIRVLGLQDNAEKGVKRQKYTMKASAFTDLFQPVMTQITGLVKHQLQQSKTARAVVLVGGFGQSPYLRNCIQQVVGTKIEVMQPPNGWSAVARGALLKALHDTAPGTSRVGIAIRLARKAYGVTAGIPYDGLVHVGYETYWDSERGRLCVWAMDWFLKRGDEVDQQNPLTTEYYWVKKVLEGRPTQTSIALNSFTPDEEEDAPSIPGPMVKEFVRLEADLSRIPLGQIPITTGSDGFNYYRLDYQIKVAFFSAHMEFTLWYKGIQYGKVQAEFV